MAAGKMTCQDKNCPHQGLAHTHPLPKKVCTLFPTSSDERKLYPMVTGLLDYFPRALAAVAHLSLVANDQHNPDEPLHWARGKSSDHLNTMLRHFMERRGVDTDGERHTTKAAWRMLALLELELEEVDE